MHCLAPDHPVFDGHFPGDPIVPGAYLLALVFAEARARLAEADPAARVEGLESAKFLRPVRPGTRFSIELRPTAPTRMRFRVVADDGREHASGMLALSTRASMQHEPEQPR